MATILIAEDDPEINALMALTLRLEGHTIVQARDGALALDAARDPLRRPDLILLDVMMPRMSGYDVARNLQHETTTSTIPIIFVTAKHATEDLVQGLEMAVDYVCKPFAMPELLARVKSALRMSSLQKELRESNEQLAQMAVTDPLTGLPNRRAFEPSLEAELQRACRYGPPVALLLFDLDHFKRVNDTWGHPQGDEVLRAFAQLLHDTSRRVDRVARLGGEEFAALLPSTDAAGAASFAEKMLAATQELKIPRVGPDVDGAPPISVTVSIGTVIVQVTDPNDCNKPIDEIAATVFHCADQCLYRAKAGGRNRAVIESLFKPAALPRA